MVAVAMVATDPDRAIGLLTEAERLAQSEDDQYTNDFTLSKVAGPVAAIDPDRAERIAQSITDPETRVNTLLKLANV